MATQGLRGGWKHPVTQNVQERQVCTSIQGPGRTHTHAHAHSHIHALHTHIYPCTHCTLALTYACSLTYTGTRSHMSLCTHSHNHTVTHVHMHACTLSHICVHTHIHVCISTHMHTRAHTHSSSGTEASLLSPHNHKLSREKISAAQQLLPGQRGCLLLSVLG